MFRIRKVYPKQPIEVLVMKREHIVIDDSVVQEYVCFTEDGRIICYMHPDLVDACSESCYSDMPSYEDTTLSD